MRNWFFVAFGIALCSNVAAGKGVGPIPSLAETCTQNFEAWDKNHDGFLDGGEVSQSMTDPAVKDASAAAITALQRWYWDNPWLPPTPRAFLESYRPPNFTPLPKEMPEPEKVKIRKERTKAGPFLGPDYQAAIRRIRGGPYAVFGPEGPKLSDVHQGAMGDCWLISHIGAVVNRDPNDIRRMVRVTDTGYKIFFPDEVVVEMPTLTDAQIGINDLRLNNGLWPQILRMAFYRRPKMPRRGPKGNLYLYEAKAMEGLTGFNMRTIGLVNGYAKTVPENALARLANNVRSSLKDTLDAHKLAVADTAMVAMPFGIPGHHSYAVLAFDPVTDLVTLWNPWGDNYHPREVPGKEPDYPRTGGVFTVPVPVLVRAFSQLLLEEKTIITYERKATP